MGYYGDFVSRSFAFMLDAAIISISFAFIIWLVNVTATTMQFRTVVGFTLSNYPKILYFLDQISVPQTMAALALVYTLAYFIFFWSLTGQTLGKALLGLRVVAKNGKRMMVWHSIIRLMGYFVSIVTLFLGFVWVIFDERRQGLHDKLAGTYVIYTWDAIPDEQFLADKVLDTTGHLPDGYTPKVK
jgi:uncharacterized RDD family membrane protein YckC